MSGFSHFVSGAQSVVSNVQTLVSTFKTAKDLCSEFRRWRKEKKRKQGRSTNPVPDEENLERSLDRSGPRVQREYDRYFYYMGPRFADGDDACKIQLLQYIIQLQHNVINLLSQANSPGSRVVLDLPKLLCASNDTQQGSVNALAGQYQRMLQERPLQRALDWHSDDTGTSGWHSGPPDRHSNRLREPEGICGCPPSYRCRGDWCERRKKHLREEYDYVYLDDELLDRRALLPS